jgi:steroid 5-alpha reductase family enzyme
MADSDNIRTRNPNWFVDFAWISGIFCLSFCQIHLMAAVTRTIVMSGCLWHSTGQTFQTLAILL